MEGDVSKTVYLFCCVFCCWQAPQRSGNNSDAKKASDPHASAQSLCYCCCQCCCWFCTFFPCPRFFASRRVAGAAALLAPLNAAAAILQDELLVLPTMRLLWVDNSPLCFKRRKASTYPVNVRWKSSSKTRKDGACGSSTSNKVTVPLFQTSRPLVLVFNAAVGTMKAMRAPAFVSLPSPKRRHVMSSPLTCLLSLESLELPAIASPVAAAAASPAPPALLLRLLTATCCCCRCGCCKGSWWWRSCLTCIRQSGERDCCNYCGDPRVVCPCVNRTGDGVADYSVPLKSAYKSYNQACSFASLSGALAAPVGCGWCHGAVVFIKGMPRGARAS